MPNLTFAQKFILGIVVFCAAFSAIAGLFVYYKLNVAPAEQTPTADSKQASPTKRQRVSDAQTLVDRALALEEGTTLDDARKALGKESGSCWSEKDNYQMYAWDAGGDHLPLTIPFRDQKLLEKPERPKKDAQARTLLMQLVLQGDCFELDPK